MAIPGYRPTYDRLSQQQRGFLLPVLVFVWRQWRGTSH